MSNIKDQIITLVKQRHHSHKVALEQEKDPRSKHAIDLIARIREDSRLIEIINSLPEEKPSDDLEEAAEEYATDTFPITNEEYVDYPKKSAFIAGAKWQKEHDEDWLNEELIKAHLNGVMAGDRIAREEGQMPMPEDTVIFQRGVAEGRRLEREDFQGNLSWRDIKRIIQIADNMLDDPKMRVAVQNHSDEEYYKNVWKKWRKTVSG